MVFYWGNYHIYLLSCGRHLHCSQIIVLINNCWKHCCLSLLCTYVLKYLEQILRSGTAQSWVACRFNFIRNCTHIFIAIYHFTLPSAMSIAPHYHWHLVSVFLLSAIYSVFIIFIVVLLFNKHHLMSLLAIYIHI